MEFADRAVTVLSDYVRGRRFLRTINIEAALRLLSGATSAAQARSSPAKRIGILAPVTLQGRRDYAARLIVILKAVIRLGTSGFPVGVSILVCKLLGLNWSADVQVGVGLIIFGFACLLADFVIIYIASVRYIRLRSTLNDEDKHALNLAADLINQNKDVEAFAIMRELAEREDSRAVPVAALNAGLIARQTGANEYARESFSRSIAYDLQVEERRIAQASPEVLQVLAALLASEKLEVNELRSASLLSADECKMAVETLIRWGLVRQVERPNGRCTFELRHATPKPEENTHLVA